MPCIAELQRPTNHHVTGLRRVTYLHVSPQDGGVWRRVERRTAHTLSRPKILLEEVTGKIIGVLSV
jgi:hypothetical protein